MIFPLFDLNPHRRFPLVTLFLIVANAAVMAWSWSLPQAAQQQVAIEHGFMPARLTNVGQGKPVVAKIETRGRRGRAANMVLAQLSTSPAAVYPTLLTTMFLHGSLAHVALNMWMLWVFGNNIEDRLGHLVYLAFYLVSGILATLTFWATDPQGTMPVIGASGAVAAVLGAYAITFPKALVRTLVFFVIITVVDLPALVVLGVWFVLQLVSGLLGFWGVALEPVAFWAHIGGFVAGLLLMPLLSLGASPTGADWPKEIESFFQFKDPPR